MEQSPVKLPGAERRVRRSLSILPSLVREIDAIASEEGHDNFSAVVTQAIVDFLNRRRDVRAA